MDERDKKIADLEAEVRRLQLELGEAASEINCAGPVAHRIRMLKQTLSQDIHETIVAKRAAQVLSHWLRKACVEIYDSIPPMMSDVDVEECGKRFVRISNVVSNVALEVESVCAWEDPTRMAWVLEVLGEVNAKQVDEEV